jgi:hypothetical protein
MIPGAKKAKILYAKMNNRFQLSFEAYVIRIIKMNKRKKALIMKKAEFVKKRHIADLRALSETDFAVRSPGLYLAMQQQIDNRMKKLLKEELKYLKKTNPRMAPIIF